MTAQERRDEIVDYLSIHAKATAQELAERFHCSIRTVMNDVNFLTDKYPIYTVQGNGGGIRVMEGRELHRRNLKKSEEDTLRKVLDRGRWTGKTCSRFGISSLLFPANIIFDFERIIEL